MKFLYNKNKKELEKQVAKKIKSQINKILKKKGSVVLGLVGGRSVPGVYKELSSQKLEWGKVHIFMADERYTLSEKSSNSKLVESYFFNNLLSRNFHPFDPKNHTAESYYSHFKSYTQKFDIVILSAGEDSHVASLFPNHPSIKNEFVDFIEVKKAPISYKNRISASRKLIEASTYAHLLFFDEIKKKALKKFMNKKLSEVKVPSKIVNNIQDSFVYTNVKV